VLEAIYVQTRLEEKSLYKSGRDNLVRIFSLG